MQALSLIILVVLFLNSSTATAQKKSENQKIKWSKPLKILLRSMAFVKGGQLEPLGGNVETLTSKDSMLVATTRGSIPSKISPFLMAKYEVSNYEYLQFLDAKVKELGEETALAKYLPDTTVWAKSDTPNAPLEKHYLRHSAYAYHPVVGVSWEQANAYCSWITQEVNKSLKEANHPPLPPFRLPTENEWQYAAAGGAELTNYAWGSHHLQDQDGPYLDNFGPLREANGVNIKPPPFDKAGHFITVAVNSYTPNNYGIHHLSGNVSEWVADQLFLYRLQPNVSYQELRSLAQCTQDSIYQRIKNRITPHPKVWEFSAHPEAMKERIIRLVARDIQQFYATVDNRNRPRIIKGGSWGDSPIYLMIDTRQCLPQKSASAKVGFRIAVSIPNYLIE